MQARGSICSTRESASNRVILHVSSGAASAAPLFCRGRMIAGLRVQRRKSMKAIPVFALLAVAFALPATAQLGPKYSDWAEGPVQHLMTKEEKKQWKAIQT